ncbi:MAG: hypothetical protein KJ799_00990 [Bacteroidetes bacterium]|nr:hypothetical protein [Bacteroidota bacterium]MBU1677538.1 hypothetical protein [Bacteroidota bacterium]MBU2505293.1 hypothetical protein [Bacteroidota bacterium]
MKNYWQQKIDVIISAIDLNLWREHFQGVVNGTQFLFSSYPKSYNGNKFSLNNIRLQFEFAGGIVIPILVLRIYV